MPFNEHALLAALAPEPDVTYLVAYSGGLDSQVLLHSLLQLKAQGQLSNPVKALHINHGLSSHADKWQLHCQQYCESNQVPYESCTVELQSDESASMEDQAREARYSVFRDHMEQNVILLMAHHLGDQLETFLFRLLRGSGIRGLKGIPSSRPLAAGIIQRPLLPFSRAELEQYAHHHQLSWVEDESNASLSIDRNFLRHEILPKLQSRWPGLPQTWQRTMQIMDQTESLLEEIGNEDLASVIGHKTNEIDISELLRFSRARQLNCLRLWLDRLHLQFGTPLPDRKNLERLIDEIIPAAEDAAPCVRWSNQKNTIEIRRFQNRLYALSPVDAIEMSECSDGIHWDLQQPLILPFSSGNLSLVDEHAELIKDTFAQLTIRFRKGGELVRLKGKQKRPLKKILQDGQLVPWLRFQIPLLYDQDRLVAIGDKYLCEDCPDFLAEKAPLFHWQRSDIRCG